MSSHSVGSQPPMRGHLAIPQYGILYTNEPPPVLKSHFSNDTKVAAHTRLYCIKQNVTFQESMHFENFRLHQIQNGHLSAIIHFHMAVIW